MYGISIILYKYYTSIISKYFIARKNDICQCNGRGNGQWRSHHENRKLCRKCKMSQSE